MCVCVCVYTVAGACIIIVCVNFIGDNSLQQDLRTLKSLFLLLNRKSKKADLVHTFSVSATCFVFLYLYYTTSPVIHPIGQ